VDPDLPTLAVRQSASPTTGPVERLINEKETDNNADTADMLLPGGAPTLATSNYEAETTSFPSTTQRNEVAGFPPIIASSQHEPIKRRWLDLGELMVKMTT